MSHQRDSPGPPMADSKIADDENEWTREISSQSKQQEKKIQASQQAPHRNVYTIQSLQIPGNLDVLFGRGKPFQEHPGNIRMQTIVERNRGRYQKEAKLLKIQVVKEVIDEIRNHNAPVRILKPVGGDERCKKSQALEGPWCEASEEETLKKIAHCLRSKTPKPILSVDKIKKEQHSSLMASRNPIDKAMTTRLASLSKFPQAGSNTNLKLRKIPMQRKSPSAFISSKTQDEVLANGHEKRPHHRYQWRSLTTGGRKTDVAHVALSHSPELKPASKPKNRREVVQRPLPGQISRSGLLNKDDTQDNHNVDASASIAHVVSLPISDSHNPEQVPNTRIKPFTTSIQYNRAHSEPQPEQVSPESLAIFLQALQSGPTDDPHSFSDVLNKNNTGNVSISQSASLPIGDSNNLEQVSRTRIEPFTPGIEHNGDQSELQLEEISPESLAILMQSLQSGLIDDPHPSSDVLNKSNRGNFSTSQKLNRKLPSIPELDSSIELPVHHAIQNDTKPMFDEGYSVQLEGKEIVDSGH